MKTIKDKQFLIFYLPDGKTCRYDLSTGTTYGFSGRPVKSINTQLRGYTIFSIIQSIEEQPYREFLSYIDRHYGNCITNFGSLLTIAARHKEAEQFYTAGVKLAGKFRHNISEVPKGLIKLCREYDICLDYDLYNNYINDPDRIHNILNLNLNFTDSKSILNYYIRHYNIREKVNTLLDEYNYSFKNLFQYIDDLYTYEAITNSFGWVIQELYDYVRQASKISKHYDKYPQHFLSTLPIIRRNYDRLKQFYDEEEFKSIHSKSAPLYEKKIKEYSFIYPEKIQDIKDEAVQQSNCVASYISSVLSHQCHIMFMRETKHPEQSLITLEIKNNKIVQARGRYNRMPTETEREVINSWNMSVAA